MRVLPPLKGFEGTKQFELKGILSMAWNHCMTCPILNIEASHIVRGPTVKGHLPLQVFLVPFVESPGLWRNHSQTVFSAGHAKAYYFSPLQRRQ